VRDPRRRVGVVISVPRPSLYPAGFPGLLQHVIRAEELGFDEIAVGEHLLISEELERAAGRFRWPFDAEWPEPFIMLAAIASRTSRVRLVTDVVIAPLRPAVVLAKLAATLDMISGGRLELGLGTGWQEHEYQAVGVPFEARVRRLEETIAACRTLWSGGPVDFQSDSVYFHSAWSSPFPVQPGGPPIFIAGAPIEAVARRVARLGDGWTTIPRADSEVESGIALCRAAFEAAGRDPVTLRVRLNAWNNREAQTEVDLDAVFAKVERYWGMGVTDVNLVLADLAGTPEEAEAVFQAASEHFRLRAAL
jgi:probable F420-dependent oxidoreductase